MSVYENGYNHGEVHDKYLSVRLSDDSQLIPSVIGVESLFVPEIVLVVGRESYFFRSRKRRKFEKSAELALLAFMVCEEMIHIV